MCLLTGHAVLALRFQAVEHAVLAGAAVSVTETASAGLTHARSLYDALGGAGFVPKAIQRALHHHRVDVIQSEQKVDVRLIVTGTLSDTH